MRLRRLLWVAAGAATGAYLASRRRRGRGRERQPLPLRDHRGRPLQPEQVELAGGERVPVIDTGRGPAVVLVPGLTGDAEVFRYQIPALSATYRVIVPGLRVRFAGVEPRFDQYAHDLARVLDARGVRSACLLGLSFGGPIAIRFTTLYPNRVWALILTNTLARLDLSHVGLNRTLFIPVARFTSRWAPERLARRLADVWGRWGIWVYDPSPGNARVVEYELGSSVRVPASLGGARMELFRKRDLRDDLKRIEQPALVIVGAADTYTPIQWQREIADLLPNATLIEIPDGGHLALMSRAEIFNEAVLEWLAEQRARPGPARTPASAEEHR